MWGYLGEFWNAITQVGEYTIEFFQSIGNAVAGAVGNLFEFLNHSLSDVFIFAGWFFGNLGNIFSSLFSPIQYFFYFLKSFVASAVASPTNTTIWTFTDQIKEVFNVVPYWETLTTILAVCILLLAGTSILKHFIRA